MLEINDKFYKEENFYNNDIYKDYEEDIEKYINQYDSSEYYKIIQNDKRTNIVNVFSEMKSNIIKWYPFEKNKKMLEIGSNYGEITCELVKKCNDITLIEFSKKKAECISKRLEDADNVKIFVCTSLKEISLEEKYDYITLLGIAEYAKQIGFKNLEELILWAQNHLTEEGKIFLAIDNKFGVRNLAGTTRNKDEVPFASFKPYIEKNYELYGKTEIENILKKNNITNYKFYYPVPNYNLTHLIYTDKYMPKKADYNLYYREDEEILFNELNFMYEAIKNEKFDLFTNSYLIEINKKQDLDCSDICFVNYSNMRKIEYKIITKISPSKVTKQSYEEKGLNHIKQIQNNIDKLKTIGFNVCENNNENEIISPYVSMSTMDEYLANIANSGKTELFYEEIFKWEKFLKEKLKTVSDTKKTIFENYNISISEEQKSRLNFVEDGFIDLIFQNTFYDGTSDYIVFDQEWYEEGLPLQFIMYRSIKQLFFKYKYLEKKIDKMDLYKKYGIEEYIEIFEELEKRWQKNIVDAEIMDFYSQKWSRIISIEDIKFRHNQELGKVYNKKDELEKQVSILTKENDLLKKKLETIENSKSYRWTKIFRKKN